MGSGAAEATGLGFFVLLSTLVCWQPAELILGFFVYFINFHILLPLPSPVALLSLEVDDANSRTTKASNLLRRVTSDPDLSVVQAAADVGSAVLGGRYFSFFGIMMNVGLKTAVKTKVFLVTKIKC